MSTKTSPQSGTLTDRYVWAVIRTVPAPQRPELEPEIRELVGDLMEAKLAADVTADEAERAALIELGDPERLAASYADRPLHLIGPRYYLEWWRLLRFLLVTVVPIVAVVIFVIELLDEGFGPAIGGAIGISVSVAVHIAFWVTVTFAIIERTAGSAGQQLTAWTPEQLPQLPSGNGNGRIELGASIAFIALWAAALVWQSVASPVKTAGGSPIDVLQPDLWSFWLPYFLALSVLEAGLAVAVYRHGGWGWPFVGGNLLLNAAFAVPSVWLLASGEMLNPGFFDRLGWPEGAQAGSLTSVIAIVSIIAITVWDTAENARKAWRRDAPPSATQA